DDLAVQGISLDLIVDEATAVLAGELQSLCVAEQHAEARPVAQHRALFRLDDFVLGAKLRTDVEGPNQGIGDEPAQNQLRHAAHALFTDVRSARAGRSPDITTESDLERIEVLAEQP